MFLNHLCFLYACVSSITCGFLNLFSRNQAKYLISRLFVILGQYHSEDCVFACALRLFFAWITPPSWIRHDYCAHTRSLYRHRIRFVARSGVPLNPEYGWSAMGTERLILVPSTTVQTKLIIILSLGHKGFNHTLACSRKLTCNNFPLYAVLFTIYRNTLLILPDNIPPGTNFRAGFLQARGACQHTQ